MSRRRTPQALVAEDATTGLPVVVICEVCGRRQSNLHSEPLELELGGRWYAGCRFCGHPRGRYA